MNSKHRFYDTGQRPNPRRDDGRRPTKSEIEQKLLIPTESQIEEFIENLKGSEGKGQRQRYDSQSRNPRPQDLVYRPYDRQNERNRSRSPDVRSRSPRDNRFMPSHARRDERSHKPSFGENPEYSSYPENSMNRNQYPMNFNQMPPQMMGMNYQGNMANMQGTSMMPNMTQQMMTQMMSQMMPQFMPQLMAQMDMMKNNTMFPTMQNKPEMNERKRDKSLDRFEDMESDNSMHSAESFKKDKSPPIIDRREWKKSNRIPTPPPPPSFSECKKTVELLSKKESPQKPKPEVKKDTKNVISALLDNKDVSLSSLLEAAMETTGNKVLELEPRERKNILQNCRLHISRLYSLRTSRIGAFLPLPISKSGGLSESSWLSDDHPPLEFCTYSNRRPEGVPHVSLDFKKKESPCFNHKKEDIQKKQSTSQNNTKKLSENSNFSTSSISKTNQDWKMNQHPINSDAHTSKTDFSGKIDCVIGRRTEYQNLQGSFVPPTEKQQPSIPVYPNEIEQEFVRFKPSYNVERQEIKENPNDEIELKNQIMSLKYTTIKLKKYQNECAFQRNIIKELSTRATISKRNESYVLIDGILCFKANLKHKGQVYVHKDFQFDILRALHLDKHEFSKKELTDYYENYFYCVSKIQKVQSVIDFVFKECVGCDWIKMAETKPTSAEDLLDKKAQQFIESCREKNYSRDKNRNERSLERNSRRSLEDNRPKHSRSIDKDRHSRSIDKDRHSRSIDKDKNDRKESYKIQETRRRRSRSINNKRKRSRSLRSKSRESKSIKKQPTKVVDEVDDDFPIDLDNLIVVDECVSGDEVEKKPDELPKTPPKEITDEKIDEFLSMMSKMNDMTQTPDTNECEKSNLKLTIEDIYPPQKINSDTDINMVETSNLSEVMSFIERDSYPEVPKIQKPDLKVDSKQNTNINYDVSEFSDESGGEISLSALEMCDNKNQHDMMDLQDNFFDEIDRISASFKMEGGHLVECSAQGNNEMDQGTTTKQLEPDFIKEESSDTNQQDDLKISEFVEVTDDSEEIDPTKERDMKTEKLNEITQKQNISKSLDLKLSPDDQFISQQNSSKYDSEMPVEKSNKNQQIDVKHSNENDAMEVEKSSENQPTDVKPSEEISGGNDDTKRNETIINLSEMAKLSNAKPSEGNDAMSMETRNETQEINLKPSEGNDAMPVEKSKENEKICIKSSDDAAVKKTNENQPTDVKPLEENPGENDTKKGNEANINLSDMTKLSEFEEASSDDQLDSKGLTDYQEGCSESKKKQAEQPNSKPKPLDFKIRIRNEQIKNPKLLDFINKLDSGVKNLEPYRMKGSMLCQKTTSGVKIVTYQEGIENFCSIVHTMGHIHTPYDRSLFIFGKHFVPFPGIEEIMKNVINNCSDCGSL